MVIERKCCLKLNDSIFTILIHPCERNSGSKGLSEGYAKSQDYLLTHSLPIISNILLRKDIYCNIFTCHYLRKEKHFIPFFFFFFFFHFAFFKFRFNFEHFQKKTTLIADVLLNLHTT